MILFFLLLCQVFYIHTTINNDTEELILQWLQILQILKIDSVKYKCTIQIYWCEINNIYIIITILW